MVDSMLAAIPAIKIAAQTLKSFLIYMDLFVFYIRSLLPLTISALFDILYVMFSAWFLFFVFRFVLRSIPVLNKNID